MSATYSLLKETARRRYLTTAEYGRLGKALRKAEADGTVSPVALAAIRLEVEPPKATPYFWVRVPEGHTSESFTELVLEEAGVLVSPGPAYGPSGEGFFRIALTAPDDRIEEAVERMREHLS